MIDPASDWDALAEKASDLLVKEKVAVVFGCWTSLSRKAVLPVFEQYRRGTARADPLASQV